MVGTGAERSGIVIDPPREARGMDEGRCDEGSELFAASILVDTF